MRWKESGETGLMERKNHMFWEKYGWLLFFCLFFSALWLFFEPGIYPDSQSYIAMQEGREPVYPLFLAGLFRLFGESAYLRAATFLQNLLTAVSCTFFVKTLGKLFDLNGFWQAAVAGCSLIPYLLTPLASSSHMLLGNAILTEGLTFPLHTLYALCLIKGVMAKEKKARSYLAAALLALLLSLIRAQMLVTLVVWLLVVCWDGWRHHFWREILAGALLFILLLGARGAVNQTYNELAFRGYTGADTGSYNILTTLLYLSDEEDASWLAGEEKSLFLAMQEQMKAGKMTAAWAPEGILQKAYHYEEFYDIIGFEVQQPCLFDYVKEKGVPEGEVLNEVLRLSSGMNEALFSHLAGAYAGNYLATVASGLTRSVSASGTLFGLYSVFLYFLVLILMVYLYKENSESGAVRLMLLALLLILVNVTATALLIMCLSRYMIYNTAIFYAALLMLIKEWGRTKNQQARLSGRGCFKK